MCLLVSHVKRSIHVLFINSFILLPWLCFPKVFQRFVVNSDITPTPLSPPAPDSHTQTPSEIQSWTPWPNSRRRNTAVSQNNSTKLWNMKEVGKSCPSMFGAKQAQAAWGAPRSSSLLLPVVPNYSWHCPHNSTHCISLEWGLSLLSQTKIICSSFFCVWHIH